jgi:hypothetical protein
MSDEWEAVPVHFYRTGQLASVLNKTARGTSNCQTNSEYHPLSPQFRRRDNLSSQSGFILVALVVVVFEYQSPNSIYIASSAHHENTRRCGRYLRYRHGHGHSYPKHRQSTAAHRGHFQPSRSATLGTAVGPHQASQGTFTTSNDILTFSVGHQRLRLL